MVKRGARRHRIRRSRKIQRTPPVGTGSQPAPSPRHAAMMNRIFYIGDLVLNAFSDGTLKTSLDFVLGMERAQSTSSPPISKPPALIPPISRTLYSLTFIPIMPTGWSTIGARRSTRMRSFWCTRGRSTSGWRRMKLRHPMPSSARARATRSTCSRIAPASGACATAKRCSAARPSWRPAILPATLAGGLARGARLSSPGAT